MNNKTRVSIFIDGSNFYYSTAKKGMRVDFQKFIEELAGSRKLITAFYYVAPLDISEDVNKYWKHQKFLDMLRKIKKFKVVLCTLKKIKTAEGSFIYLVKGDDVHLSHDLLMGAVDNLYDTAIIVSGDEDFMPIIKTVRERYRKKVENAYFSKSSSYNLRRACDSSIPLDKILSKIIENQKEH
ncbi:hypothetical protein A3K73_03670 [Candidatus Pacearchaeota archaeon RBG_13_36_9]|nr:MAG: hypothetical protein A3K73_03670 [Candidatus Pacearchaeota archaeon RBG_13_36_9]HJX50342.1 NYN domain-containing protein [Candidatus Nanoarchaeia archaeon]